MLRARSPARSRSRSTPDKAAAPDARARSRTSNYDKSVARVVVIGNGIAGVTAADHLRRRHPDVEIDLIAEEPHHLYNRMGISRLVYGRSAMQGLYLNPDAWYDERRITAWLNTRALGIDRDRGEVALGTGEKLRYDRLILATGSSSFVPPIEGFGAPGTGGPALGRRRDPPARLRPAPRDRAPPSPAAACSASRPPTRCTSSACKTAVLERSDRLLRRQLDARAAELLRAYLEGLGLEFVTERRDRVGRRATAALRRRQPQRRAAALDGDILLVAAGIRPTSTSRARRACESSRGVLVDERMRTDDPHDPRRRRRRRVRRPAPRAVADRGRAGRGRGRQRRRRRQGLHGHRARSRSSRSSASS